jgi:hypothetical protein
MLKIKNANSEKRKGQYETDIQKYKNVKAGTIYQRNLSTCQRVAQPPRIGLPVY